MALICRKCWHWVGSGIIALIVLGLFIRLGYIVADGLRAPFVVSDAQVLTPQVRVGEPISVIYTNERRRLCTTTIAEFWIDLESGAVLYRTRVPGGYSPLGQRRTLVTLFQPVVLPVGRYAYRSVIESDCGITTFTFQVPDAEFEIVP